MFQDKKSTIKNKITAELQELTGLKWSFGLTVDFFKDDKKLKGTFYSNQYATLLPGYDPSEEHNHIMYYDANNLYGWTMSQPLPYSGFKWVDKPPTEPGKVVSWKWTWNIRLNFMSRTMNIHLLRSD